MIIKDPALRLTALRFFSWFRKIYSPVIFWLVWLFSIRWMLDKGKRDRLAAYYSYMKRKPIDEFYTDLTLVSRLNWKREKLNGLGDFTYGCQWICLDDRVADKWGRDCDDLAEIWYRYMYDKGWDEAYVILCCSEDLSTAHMFAVGRCMSAHGNYIICDNLNKPLPVAGYSVVEAVNDYLQERQERYEETGNMRYSNTVWTFYRIQRNF